MPTETQLYKNLYGPSTKLENKDPEDTDIEDSPLFGVDIAVLAEYRSLQYLRKPVVEATILLATSLSFLLTVLKRTVNF